MKKKIQFMAIFTIVFFIVSLSLLVAQEKSEKNGGAGYFSTGIAMLDIKDLNASLKAKGYPEFDDNFIAMGGGGHSFINKFLLGGEGFGLAVGDNSFSMGGIEYKTNLAVGYGFFDIGYLIYSQKRLNIFPMLGIGGGGVTMQIIEKGSVSFSDVLSNPKRNVQLDRVAFLLDISLNAEYFITFEENESGYGGLILGVKAGYTFSPFGGDWKIDEYDVTGGPDFNFSGPYIRVMFGGGGVSR